MIDETLRIAVAAAASIVAFVKSRPPQSVISLLLMSLDELIEPLTVLLIDMSRRAGRHSHSKTARYDS